MFASNTSKLTSRAPSFPQGLEFAYQFLFRRTRAVQQRSQLFASSAQRFQISFFGTAARRNKETDCLSMTRDRDRFRRFQVTCQVLPELANSNSLRLLQAAPHNCVHNDTTTAVTRARSRASFPDHAALQDRHRLQFPHWYHWRRPALLPASARRRSDSRRRCR